MSEIGAIDIDATVEQAFAPYRDNPVVRVFVMIGELVGAEPETHDVNLACVVDHDALVNRVAAIAQQTNTPAKSAGYAYDEATNTLVIAEPMQGVMMDEATTVTRIENVLGASGNGDPNRLAIQAEATLSRAGTPAHRAGPSSSTHAVAG